MTPLHVCWRCGDWPDAPVHLEDHDWCGPCAPWARAPWPFGDLAELGARVLARLDRECLAEARLDAERVIAWLEGAAAAWPGPAPWRTVRLAIKARAKLLSLEAWQRPAPVRRVFSRGHCWPGLAAEPERRPRDAPPLHGEWPRELAHPGVGRYNPRHVRPLHAQDQASRHR